MFSGLTRSGDIDVYWQCRSIEDTLIASEFIEKDVWKHTGPSQQDIPKRGATTCNAIFIHYFQKHATEISKMDFLKLENLIPSMFGVVSMLSGNRLSKPEVFRSTTKIFGGC